MKSILGKLAPAVFLREAKASAASTTEHERKLVELCSLAPEETLRRLGAAEQGLKSEQVETLRAEFGANDLAPPEKAGLILEILGRFRNPLVIQLFVIALVSLLTVIAIWP